MSVGVFSYHAHSLTKTRHAKQKLERHNTARHKHTNKLRAAKLCTRLQVDASEAARVLREIATDVKSKSSARVSAAKGILDFASRVFELDEIIERIERSNGRSDG